MTTRRLLIALPIIAILFLLQSYFWVPTYDEQAKDNPERLKKYVTASIGDAQLLNPTLSADSASSEINGLVFEGLLDYDENLDFRARLATSWDIYEEAYFYVNDEAFVPGLGKADASELVKVINQARREHVGRKDALAKSLANVEAIEILPPHQLIEEVTETTSEGTKVKVRLQISAPPRLKLTLHTVDRDLFSNLKEILGS